MHTHPISFLRRTGSRKIVVVSGLLVLFAFVMSQIAGEMASDQVEKEVGNNLSNLAYQTADMLDRGLFERYREVQLLASRSELANPAISAHDKRVMLEMMQQTYPYYAWLGLTDQDGKVVVSGNKLLEGADVSKRPWFRNAFAGNYLTDVHEAMLLAKLLPNPGNDPMRFVDVAFPYLDKAGKPAGVVGVHLSWRWADEVKESILRLLRERSNVDVLILSRESRVLLGPPGLIDKVLTVPSADAAKYNTGFAQEQWADGKRYLVGYSPSRGYRAHTSLEWKVLVRQELDEAYRPVAQLKQKILVGGLLTAGAFLVFGLLAFRVLRRSSAPKTQA